jgi:hypothetical protein
MFHGVKMNGTFASYGVDADNIVVIELLRRRELRS